MVSKTSATADERPIPPPPYIAAAAGLQGCSLHAPNSSQVRYGHSDKYAREVNETLAWPNDPRELCEPHRDALDEYQARLVTWI